MSTAEYWIKRKGNVKATGTKGEKDFQAYLDSRGLDWEHDVTLSFTTDMDLQDHRFPFIQMRTFDFQMDFVRRTKSGSIDLDIEIDGKGHKEKWDHWKDSIKNAQGVKVIHIGAELCKRRYWTHLDRLLPQALTSKEATVYLDRYAQ